MAKINTFPTKPFTYLSLSVVCHKKRVKFFKRNIDLEKSAQLHSAGQTMTFKSPFNNLEISEKVESVSEEFESNWMIGFYMDSFFRTDENNDKFLEVLKTVDLELVKTQLLYFNWRNRLNGGYFAAVLDFQELTEIIGILLLKSELTYAGEGYILALTSFNSSESISYLIKYLDYYLTRKKLFFDQHTVLAALAILDKKNGTSLLSDKNYIDKWNKFNSNSRINLEDEIEYLNQKLLKIQYFKKKITAYNKI